MIDKFSKFASAYTIPARSCINVVKSLKQYFCVVGIPTKLVFDQGTEFSGKIFTDFCNQYNIETHVTSFQQSSSNSPVERLHSSLTEIYRIIFENRKAEKLDCDHEEILCETLITYNNAIHSATKFTPFELFSGRTHVFNKEVTFDSEHDYLQKLNEFQNTLYPRVKDQLRQKMEARVDKLNKDRTQPITVVAEDTVFRKENRRNKLTPRFSKHKVLKDSRITLVSAKKQKLHKSKIRDKIIKKQIPIDFAGSRPSQPRT